MKKQIIREGTYETNSSSAHSISLAKRVGKPIVYDTIYPESDGVIYLSDYQDDSQENFERKNDPKIKAILLFSAINDVEKIRITSDYYRKLFKNFKLKIKDLEEVILEMTGAEKIEWPSNTFDISVHQFLDFEINTKEDLKDFIFDKNSWMFTWYDNQVPSDSFLSPPVYLENGDIENLKMDTIVTVEGFPKEIITYPYFEKNRLGNIIMEIIKSYDIPLGDHEIEAIDMEKQTVTLTNKIQFNFYIKKITDEL